MPAQELLHRVILSTLLGATTLAACTSWRVQQVPPAKLVDDQRPKAVRIERVDGSRVILSGPRLVADSLSGTRGDAHSYQRVSVPLADIKQIAVRRENALKTSGLILGILAVPFAVLIYCKVKSCFEFTVMITSRHP